MTLKQYLLLMSLAASLCWIAWFFIMLSTDPTQSNTLIIVFFYFSLYLAILGTFSVIGFLIKMKVIKNDEIIFRHVKKTFRQSIILASLIVLALFLLQRDLLTWWNSILLALLFVVLEGVIFTNRHYKNNDYVK